MMMVFEVVNGLSSSSNSNSILGGSSDIQIVGTPGGALESLPYSYVQRFPRWSVEGENRKLIPLPRDNGFVDPTSTQELWWPKDLNVLQVRPTLDVLLHSGMPKYTAGGLQVRTLGDDGTTEWRNYGMNSQPLAKQWTTFGFAVEPQFRVETFLGQLPSNDKKDDKDSDGDGEGTLWKILKRSSPDDMKQTLENMAEFLSSVEEEDDLLSGFHILSIPTITEWTDLPQIKDPMALVALATAEPDAEALLNLDNGLVAMTATSILAVRLSQIEAGKKSEYLPDAYKALYL